jgi:hypothetical protein
MKERDQNRAGAVNGPQHKKRLCAASAYRPLDEVDDGRRRDSPGDGVIDSARQIFLACWRRRDCQQRRSSGQSTRRPFQSTPCVPARTRAPVRRWASTTVMTVNVFGQNLQPRMQHYCVLQRRRESPVEVGVKLSLRSLKRGVVRTRRRRLHGSAEVCKQTHRAPAQPTRACGFNGN